MNDMLSPKSNSSTTKTEQTSKQTQAQQETQRPQIDISCLQDPFARIVTFSEKFPVELRTVNQWLVYRLEWDSKAKKYAKKPKAPRLGTSNRLYNAGTASPDEWTSFDEARDFIRLTQHQFDDERCADGLAFVFTEDDPFVGIDLDDHIQDGEPDDVARRFLEELDTFGEVSQSGNGLHLIARIEGDLDPEYYQKSTDLGIEFYTSGRFFAMTGDHICGTPNEVRDCTDVVLSLQREFLDERNGDRSSTNSVGTSTSQTKGTLSHLINRPPQTRSVTSDQVIATLHKYDQRDVLALHRGQNSYKSPSEADASYFVRLAFWCKGDPYLMEQVARDSRRVREKWDEKRGSQTWLDREIQDACSFQDEHFKGRYVPREEVERYL